MNPPADVKVIVLRPDVLMGPESNSRQKDETRRYDNSEYQYVKLSRDDYRLMAQAGINCVQVNAEQAPWADDLGLFYWGGGDVLKYPESLYRSQYLVRRCSWTSPRWELATTSCVRVLTKSPLSARASRRRPRLRPSAATMPKACKV